MKKLITLLFVLFCFSSFGQVYQLMPQYGYQAPRMAFDSTLQIPTVCGVPTLKSVQFVNRKGAIAFDSCNNRFYTYNPKTLTWSQVSGGGGSTDTTSLSSRINLKLDSVKRRSDSVFAYRNGTEVYQFKDSTGNDTAAVVKATVRNAESFTITKGQVVFLFGATGDLASIKLAKNTSDTFSSKTLGIVKNDIASGATGIVITQGVVEKLNTAAYTSGDVLWLDSVAGQLTKNKPVAPNHTVFVGIVERANAGNGQIYVKPQNGYELGELHNVLVNNERQDAVFYFDSTNRVWKAKSAYSLVDTTKLSSRIDQRVRYTDTASMLAPYFRRSLSANDTIKTNGKVLELNATRLTKSASLKIDTLGITADATSGLNSSDFLISTNAFTLSQINGVSTNLISMQPNVGVDISSTNATTTDGINVTSNVGAFWYVDSYDTIGILPRTNGTSGQVLKLQDGAQMVWANDNTGTTDTTSLSNRINTKLAISDTSVFQRKQVPAYSFQANGTSVAANSTATYFKDTSGTYTGTIAWTGTTAPSGTTNHSYRWTRVGKCVTLNVNLVYATNGGALTALVFDLPSDAPTPAEPAGLTGASQNMYPVLVWNTNSSNTLVSNAARGFLRNNSGNNAYEFVINITTSAVNAAYITLNYWTE